MIMMTCKNYNIMYDGIKFRKKYNGFNTSNTCMKLTELWWQTTISVLLNKQIFCCIWKLIVYYFLKVTGKISFWLFNVHIM